MKILSSQVKIIAFSLVLMAILCQCERTPFPADYHDIYGNWTIRNISGGYTGGGIEPNYDILSIRHGMSYSIYRNDTLLGKGKIEIISEQDDYLEAEFSSSNNYISSFGTKLIRLKNDTLIISDNCADCYSSLFVRSEIFSNTNYIQSDKTLDFVEVNYYPIGFQKYCNSVFFQSETLGFITCSDGSILKSSDGGKNWRQVLTGNALPLYGISFLNEQVGFAVGGQSYCGGTGCIVPGCRMFKTQDGGETWESVPLPYKKADLRIIKFFSPAFGISVGTGARFLTKDGGQTWSSFTIENIKSVSSIQLLNNNVAYISGIQGQLFKTVNGGDTWENLSFNSTYPVRTVMFLNEQSGFAAFYNSLMKTTDGGLTWHKMDYAPEYVNSMNFTSENYGVAFGSRTYASNIWDVWDAYFNIMIDGKWYGDVRITSHCTPFILNAKTFYAITGDNKLSVIRLTN